MKKILTLLMILGFSSFSLISHAQAVQNGKVTGKVSGAGKPLEAATVIVLQAIDSAIIKTTVTDKSGIFEIERLKEGKYLLRIESLGYEVLYSEPFELSAIHPAQEMAAIAMRSVSAQLNEVVVTTKRPFIEQTLDKTMVNVDASPTNVGLTALEVLEKSPGITVDKDGNISLKGKQGVLILVDGKPTYSAGAELVNMLKNLSSNNMDQIEIMSTPPAKYDAAGNSGVINIKTKKTKVKGINGSVTLGAGMGKKPKTNNSMNLNYRTGKFNMFANYSYNHNIGTQDLNLTRKFYSDASLASLFVQNTKMVNDFENHTYKLGADFYASKKTTLGFVVNGFINPGSFSTDNVTNMLNPAGKLDSITLANNKSKESWKNTGANFNLKHVFDTAGTELTADLDYIKYKSSSDQLFQNSFFDKNGSQTHANEILRGYLPSDINIYSAKIDFTKSLKKGAKLEAGVKSSYVKTDNNAQYDLWVNQSWETDKGRSNHFLYTENINAAYVNLSKPFSKKWKGQLGLRMENTNAKGDQKITNEVFERNYTQLFPTAYLGYTMNDKNQFALSYGRRIQRPDYEDLNPFYYFLDKYTYQVGNPYLKPQFSNKIEFTHTYKGFLTSSISYSKTSDIIQEVLEQIDSIHTSYIKRSNIAHQNNVNLNISALIPITKFWKANIYGEGNYNNYKGKVNDGSIDASGFGYMANVSNQFNFDKGWNLELSGFYRSKMVMGTLVAKPMGVANFAVSKQVLKNKGTVRVNFRDFLDIQQFRGYSKYQNVDFNLRNQWDNRVVSVNFTYRFSKGQAAQQRQRGGANDESNRVKAGNSN